MNTDFDAPQRTAPEFEGRQSGISCSVDEMRLVVEASTDLGDYPCADDHATLTRLAAVPGSRTVLRLHVSMLAAM
jgi:hypothetical protein